MCNGTRVRGYVTLTVLRVTVPAMRIGYVARRVSTRDQHVKAHHDALVAAGCERVLVDHASGTLARRPSSTRPYSSPAPATSSSSPSSSASGGPSRAPTRNVRCSP